MLTLLLLLFLQASTGNGCLVIGYSEPPPCACKTLKMSSKNIFDNINGDWPLYWKATGGASKAPEVLIDDCSVTMYCDEDYDLYAFDVDKDFEFGPYAAEGLCQPFPQTWLIDDGTGMMSSWKELKGICVKRTRCLCGDPYELSNANGYDYLKNNNYYNEVLKNHPFKPPNITLSEDGCQYGRACEEGWEIMTYADANPVKADTKPRNWNYQISNCDASSRWRWELRWWRPTVTQIDFVNFFAPICVDFSRTI